MQNGYFSHRDASVNIRLNTRGWGDGTSPNPAPFYMSTAGYGVFRNTMTPGRYDFLQPLALAHDESRFDAFYFYGPSLKKILEGYTLVTGRPFFPPRWGLEFGDADCYNKKGKTPDVISKVADVYRANDMPGGWILPNDGYGCGYVDLAETIRELHKRGFYTGLWTEKGLERIATEVSQYGSRVMKLDVAWVGRGYQFAMNGMRDAYEGSRRTATPADSSGRPALGPAPSATPRSGRATNRATGSTSASISRPSSGRASPASTRPRATWTVSSAGAPRPRSGTSSGNASPPS